MADGEGGSKNQWRKQENLQEVEQKVSAPVHVGVDVQLLAGDFTTQGGGRVLSAVEKEESDMLPAKPNLAFKSCRD